ncbi:MAG: SH3 domain-containing protein [Planctomycetota bacterium]|jgi:hypothetical protein
MSATNPLTILATVLTLVWAVPSWAAPEADQPADQSSYVGEVTTDNLYVRSGPSTNYYPVAKLDAGSRVRVVGQEGEWLAIVPPDGCYSLIADSYVDVGDDDIGVVNGDNVRVRAGSQLQPDKYYAIQLKLSEGAEVEILDHVEKLGSDEMGYYRIVPPAGAQLWASGKFVQRVPEELLALAAADKTALPAETGESPAAAPPQEEPAVPQPDVPDPDALKAKAEDYRAQLEQIDADLKAELAKPLFRRDFEPIIDRFTPLANQEIDEYSAVYAATRTTPRASYATVPSTTHPPARSASGWLTPPRPCRARSDTSRSPPTPVSMRPTTWAGSSAFGPARCGFRQERSIRSPSTSPPSWSYWRRRPDRTQSAALCPAHRCTAPVPHDAPAVVLAAHIPGSTR